MSVVEVDIDRGVRLQGYDWLGSQRVSDACVGIREAGACRRLSPIVGFVGRSVIGGVVALVVLFLVWGRHGALLLSGALIISKVRCIKSAV